MRSHSYKALRPAINIVKELIRRRHLVNQSNFLKKGWNRIKRKTPAVTNVEEWTNAETGVGAAIAAGNHLEKGIWALLVIAATIIAAAVYLLERKNSLKVITFQWAWFKVIAIATNNSASPRRLVRAVIIPALNALGL